MQSAQTVQLNWPHVQSESGKNGLWILGRAEQGKHSDSVNNNAQLQSKEQSKKGVKHRGTVTDEQQESRPRHRIQQIPPRGRALTQTKGVKVKERRS